MSDEHLPFKWYFSVDEEQWYEARGATTREAAIEAGRCEYGDYDFHICEATRQSFPYHLLFQTDSMFENVMENGEEYWGEDQDGPFTGTVTREQDHDLEAMLIDAFKAWTAKHNIKLEVPWAFGEMRNIEKVKIVDDQRGNEAPMLPAPVSGK